MKKYKNYEEVITGDGSKTLFSKLYDETCHSTSGAIEETRLHYISGCEVDEKTSRFNPLVVLEVGFGTGIGFLETLKASKENKLIFISFEIDKELIDIFSSKNGISFQNDNNIYSHKGEFFELYILLGNARETISDYKKITQVKAHAIYQDAFSPKRNAILWSTEWFKSLLEVAHEECIMSTYSASSSIRKSMIAAGWTLYNGAKFGVKRSSTRAKIGGQTPQDILDKLERSPAIEINDSNYEQYTLGTTP